MDTKLSILFYSKTSKKNKDGLVPIYLRVTINGVRFEQTTQRFISSDKWSVDTGHAKGNTEEARSINHFLDALNKGYILIKERSLWKACLWMQNTFE